MSEEEKKAIETISFLKNLKWYTHAFDNGTEVLTEEEKKDIDIVLNLIEKQQKEIETLKFKYQARKDRTTQEIKNLKEKEKNLLKQLKDSEKELLEVTQNVVSKDKIKEKIKYWKKERYIAGEHLVVKVLKELLEGE